jgi:translation initiation factor IF-3
VAQIRLINYDGEQVGVVETETALRMAEEIGLDLVEIAPDANPPVCKIMDFGKYKYEMAQKAREQRQNQTHIVVKEIRLRPKIETHDYETKRAQIHWFR